MKINHFISMFLLILIIFIGTSDLIKASNHQPQTPPQRLLGVTEVFTPQGSSVTVFREQPQHASDTLGAVPFALPTRGAVMSRSTACLTALLDGDTMPTQATPTRRTGYIIFPPDVYQQIETSFTPMENTAATAAVPAKKPLLKLAERVESMTPKKFRAERASLRSTPVNTPPVRRLLYEDDDTAEEVKARRAMRASYGPAACCVALNSDDDLNTPPVTQQCCVAQDMDNADEAANNTATSQKTTRRQLTNEERDAAAAHKHRKQEERAAKIFATTTGKKIADATGKFMQSKDLVTLTDKELRLCHLLQPIADEVRREIIRNEGNALKSITTQMSAPRNAEASAGTTACTAGETIDLSHIVPESAIMSMFLNPNTCAFLTKKTEAPYTTSLAFHLDPAVIEAKLSPESPLRRRFQNKDTVRLPGTFVVCLHPVDNQEGLFQSVFHTCIHRPSDVLYTRKPVSVAAEIFDGQLAFRLIGIEDVEAFPTQNALPKSSAKNAIPDDSGSDSEGRNAWW